MRTPMKWTVVHLRAYQRVRTNSAVTNPSRDSARSWSRSPEVRQQMKVGGGMWEIAE
jgi:hypothetical protein